MKILQVNCVYRKGSTGKIMYDIHKCLQREGIDSVVCYGRGAKIDESHVYKFCSELESKFYHLLNRFGWLMYAVCPSATRRLIRIIKSEKPDIVHLHCINGYCVNIYALLKFLGQSGIKTIITHHAEFFYTANCGHAYDCMRFQSADGCGNCPILREASGTKWIDRTKTSWRRMKYAFSFFQKDKLKFTAVSPWVVSRSALSPICNSFDCTFVTNGAETTIFRPATANEIASIKERIPNSDRKIILHVAASFTTDRNTIKGGYYIKQLAEMLPQYQFVVVASYMGNVESLPDNVYLWGRADGQKELAALYSSADVTVIASRRETFSMIVAESLCCGTPVVGFKAGGPETIGLKRYSAFAEYGDLNDLSKLVQHFISTSKDSDQISFEAHKVYSVEVMTNQYYQIFNSFK